jgi:hypothetical protein
MCRSYRSFCETWFTPSKNSPHGRSLRVTPCPPRGPLRLRSSQAGPARPWLVKTCPDGRSLRVIPCPSRGCRSWLGRPPRCHGRSRRVTSFAAPCFICHGRIKTVRREFSLMKTAEGACVTLNGALNAQAKGLTAVFRCASSENVPYWREARFKPAHRRSKPVSPGESLR